MQKPKINRDTVIVIGVVVAAILAALQVKNPQAIVDAATTITCALADCVDETPADAPADVTAPVE